MNESKDQGFHSWLTESEAADYCRCSLWAFRKMGLHAYNSGGRKVYFRDAIDRCLHSRPWSRAQLVPSAPPADPRLSAVRLRPYKPRKKRGADV